MQIINKDNVQESNREANGYIISGGIVVVLESAVIPDGSILWYVWTLNNMIIILLFLNLIKTKCMLTFFGGVSDLYATWNVIQHAIDNKI